MLPLFQHAEVMITWSLLEPPEKPLTFNWTMDIPCSICLLSKLHRKAGDMQQVECDVSQINDHPKTWHLTACSTEKRTQDTSRNVAVGPLGYSLDCKGNPGCTSPGLLGLEGKSTRACAKVVEKRDLKEASVSAVPLEFEGANSLNQEQMSCLSARWVRPTEHSAI